mmetsp:Transcript_28070/g.48932  ORF Transcript_28070/g.48932 Transcript_28070/m.48932 type:complete len:244 (-) Transcript_28070:99-830(-)
MRSVLVFSVLAWHTVFLAGGDSAGACDSQNCMNEEVDTSALLQLDKTKSKGISSAPRRKEEINGSQETNGTQKILSNLVGEKKKANTTVPCADDTIPAPFNPPAPPQESSLQNTGVFDVQVLDVSHVPSPSDKQTLISSMNIPPAPYTAYEEILPPTIVVQPLQPLSSEEVTEQKIARSHAKYDCQLSDWSEWSDCYDQKGDGIVALESKRTRAVITPGDWTKGGIMCPEPEQAVETKRCAKR